MTMSITLFETMNRNEFFSNEVTVGNILNTGLIPGFTKIVWSPEDIKEVMEWLWGQYEESIDCIDSNDGLIEIDGTIYSFMENGVISLGYSYSGLMEQFDELLQELHEEHDVNIDSIVELFFCE